MGHTIALDDLPAALRCAGFQVSCLDPVGILVCAAEPVECPVCRAGRMIFIVQQAEPGRLTYACSSCVLC